MKNKNKNIERVLLLLILIVGIYYQLFNATKEYLKEYFNVAEQKIIIITHECNYNKQIPKETIKNEIIKQAKAFGLSPKKMLSLAECESHFNNLADNPKSSALGVYQFLDGTWRETESWKNHHYSRTDYVANIREAMIDILNGESWRWAGCW